MEKLILKCINCSNVVAISPQYYFEGIELVCPVENRAVVHQLSDDEGESVAVPEIEVEQQREFICLGCGDEQSTSGQCLICGAELVTREKYYEDSTHISP